jgi:general stress protein 26
MNRTTQAYVDRAVAILQRIPYATLATVCPDGRPWNSPVAMVYDERLCIYWFSDKESRHSHNVRANGHVCIVVYDSTWPEGTGGQGVFLQATAREVTDPAEVSKARRLKKGQSDDPSAFLGGAVRRVYKAVPQAAWINDVERDGGAFVRDYRMPLPLSAIRSRFAIVKR